MTDISKPATPSHATPSLFGNISFPAGVFREPFTLSGNKQEGWQRFYDAFDALGVDGLKEKNHRLTRMRREDGATYNLFDKSNDTGTSWELDPVPFPITAADWRVLETGIKQRAKVLELIVRDVYGPQSLIQHNLIPAELLFANPNFLHQCHNLQPSGGQFLQFYAVDVFRDSDGGFRVLRDYGSCPSGLGYSLENRIVISRVFSDLFQESNVSRLAPFFQKMHQSFSGREPFRQKDPGIVILSPGPDSHMYFEHALLSRYLGYPLVESQDLTVRNGKVLLKKLAGLEPVEVILRHLPDRQSDPFALRRGTAVGVAGLVQAAREQSVELVNMIGSGFVDTPSLSVFMQTLCSHLIGEELILKNQAGWWCGDEQSREYVLKNLDKLIVCRAMDRAATVGQNIKSDILSAPHLFMANDGLFPSAAPAWNNNSVTSSYSVMRLFCCATDQGVEVMPGGLAISSASLSDLVEGSPEKLQSKDIWVLSDKPIEPFSMLEGLESVAEFRRGSDLPSRAADNLLWLGRYLERAEGLLRLLRAVYRRLSGEAKPQDLPEVPFLLNLLRSKNSIPHPDAKEELIPPLGILAVQLHEALFKKELNGSVVRVLTLVQEAARNVRDRLSVDCWRVINRLEDFIEGQTEDPLDHLEDTLFTLSSFSGLAMESMTRGFGWRFMDIGRRLERAQYQTNLLHVALSRKCVITRSSLEALLEISDSIMTYRSRYRTTFQLAPVLDLLLADEGNPKSLAFQLSQLESHVDNLPQTSLKRFDSPEERLVLQMLTSIRLLDLKGVLNCEDGFNNKNLLLYLDNMKNNLKDFAQSITAHYLSRVPTTPHYSTTNFG